MRTLPLFAAALFCMSGCDTSDPAISFMAVAVRAVPVGPAAAIARCRADLITPPYIDTLQLDDSLFGVFPAAPIGKGRIVEVTAFDSLGDTVYSGRDTFDVVFGRADTLVVTIRRPGADTVPDSMWMDRSDSSAGLSFAGGRAGEDTARVTLRLDTLRAAAAALRIDVSTLSLTSLSVRYDSASRAFLAANQGVKYSLHLYVKKPEEAALSLMAVSAGSVVGDTTLAFDPALTILDLGKQLAADPAGFPKLVGSLRDPAVPALQILAVLHPLDPLKQDGPLHARLFLDFAGKAPYPLR